MSYGITITQTLDDGTSKEYSLFQLLGDLDRLAGSNETLILLNRVLRSDNKERNEKVVLLEKETQEYVDTINKRDEIITGMQKTIEQLKANLATEKMLVKVANENTRLAFKKLEERNRILEGSREVLVNALTSAAAILGMEEADPEGLCCEIEELKDTLEAWKERSKKAESVATARKEIIFEMIADMANK